MTAEEAIRILDPETTAEVLAEIEYYGGFNGDKAQIAAVNEACIIAVAALRAQQEREGPKLTNPCDLCAYNPPSSLDGKPCCMCPAEAKEEESTGRIR